jgi:prepilin-type processing-associated H-X9-DG protein
MTQPSPERLWVFADEAGASINDGALAVTVRANPATWEWIDRPATFHGKAGGFAFADGHAEIHRWQDPRTAMAAGAIPRSTQSNNPDILWVMERTTAKK